MPRLGCESPQSPSGSSSGRVHNPEVANALGLANFCLLLWHISAAVQFSPNAGSWQAGKKAAGPTPDNASAVWFINRQSKQSELHEVLLSTLHPNRDILQARNTPRPRSPFLSSLISHVRTPTRVTRRLCHSPARWQWPHRPREHAISTLVFWQSNYYSSGAFSENKINEATQTRPKGNSQKHLSE